MRFVRAIAVTAAALVLAASPATAIADPALSPEVTVPAGGKPSGAVDSVAVEQRAAVIGQSWEQSRDRVVVGSGDSNGFHLMVADAATGYHWSTVATLIEPAFETDAWIGNVCVTGSGSRAVVVYAPRTFTNRADLADRGGFVAVVDIPSGEVRKLRVQASLAYFNPGCGQGETAVLTQGAGEDLDRTRILELDTTTGELAEPIVVPGQLTSAVPTPHGVVAADSGALVRVAANGERRVLAPATGVPFRVAADADGGVVFMQREKGDNASVRRARTTARGPAEVDTLATGALMDLGVASGRGGKVFVTGRKTTSAAGASANVVLVDAPVGATPSLDGQIAVTSVKRVDAVDPRAPRVDPLTPQQVEITAKSLVTGAEFTLAAVAKEAENRGTSLSPALVQAKGDDAPAARALGDDPADGDTRYCSVARNDPRNQAMQPKPRQVEWAVDQAITGSLTVSRPANWKNLGMPAYTPQGLFPPRALSGGGRVPAQVMLGITAQESNMWQAARFAVPGVTANPLIGNYFGIDYYNDDSGDDWTINWADADCGYGITQLTDGMRLAGKTKPGEVALPYDSQRAVALDFAANVAGGLRVLQDKWNQTRGAGLVVNNGDPARVENWFFAVWAYNSGFYPQSGAGQNDGAWGVGWLNNPANPRYPANRTPFLDVSYEDAAHPQDWPYPEKVMGWAGHPIELIETPGNLVAGYRAAWWLTEADRWAVKPPVTQFCDSGNNCEPGAQHTPNDPEVIGEPAGPCAHRNASGRFDLKCWYHTSNTWKPNCATTCGNELLRFDPGYAYQDDATSYPPVCANTGLPGSALVVDNLAQSVPPVRPGCTRPASNGTFAFSFPAASNGTYPGKIDVHQIGAAYGAHFWMSNTHRDPARRAVGTWKLDRAHTGPMRLMAHVPDPGARTRSADYQVNAVRGGRNRVLDQGGGSGNRWVNLGTFMFDGVTPTVSLGNVTPDGDGSQRIAWDAMAFIPVPGTFKEESVESVAVFDEDQNIDTEAPSSWLAGPLANRQKLYDWATSSSSGILGLGSCAGSPTSGCAPAALRTAMADWRTQVTTAGTDPVNHPDGASMGTWIGFAQPHTDRPTTDQRPAHFDDDDRVKIRTKATVTFVAGPDGKVVAGSEYAVYEHRTGNTHLPKFFMDLMRAISSDYGIAAPDLSYTIADLNAHNGTSTRATPTSTGILPGRAYAYAGKKPTPVDSTGSPSTDNAVCVAAITVAGGSIGYRPMLGESGPVDNMAAWVDRLEGDSRVPAKVADLAEAVREMFFDDGLLVGAESSIFTQAPPIWQELNFKACADGSIQKIVDRPLLRASWMPDQYLYHNGRAMNLNGGFSNSNQPVWRGDFKKFSALPDPNQEFPLWPNPYGPCDSATDRSGNPWDITAAPPQNPGVNPGRAHFCLDRNLATDPSHSWGQ
uniref:NocE n=1 Tax=Nocardia uniformis subsp. tsuyamanensis TaxID=96045 RepID=Q5J1Q4_NOCUT|nr:NocE [Nocardia uniformis subsp. tsuyamanensis]